MDDIARLPDPVRAREMARVPPGESEDRILRGLFWSLVYHLEPEKWDELARYEPIHPDVIAALPAHAATALDVGAGSGRLTSHLLPRCDELVAVEPSAGLRAILRRRQSAARALEGWADALPIPDRWSMLTASCAAFGPDPAILAELKRVTARGGLIALISPEHPEWFATHGWNHLAAPALSSPPNPGWIDEFFGPPDPPRHLLTMPVRD